MKHFHYLCLLAFALWSCDKTPEPDVVPPSGSAPTTFDTRAVAGTSVESFAIYVFGSDSTLVTKIEGITSDAPIKIDLPWLEELKAIAVGNAASTTTLTDSLHTLRIGLGDQNDTEVFVSDLVAFKTDAAEGKPVVLNLKRAVGKVSFVPTETAQQIEAVTAFDALAVAFKNPVTAFRPGAKTDMQYETTPVFTVNTDKAKGFAASVFSYANANMTLSLEYTLAGAVVNTSGGELPASGITVKASVNAQVNMSLYESTYLDHEFTTRSLAGPAAVRVNYVEF